MEENCFLADKDVEIEEDGCSFRGMCSAVEDEDCSFSGEDMKEDDGACLLSGRVLEENCLLAKKNLSWKRMAVLSGVCALQWKMKIVHSVERL